MDEFAWLQTWFAAQCDGDWEHQHGVSIETLDNPGWVLRVNVECTHLEERVFDEYFVDRSESDWIRAIRLGETLVISGGPNNLSEIVTLFRKWADSATVP